MAEGQRTRRVLPNEDLSNVEFETSEDVEVLPSFDSMELREDLLRGIYAYGTFYTSRSPERPHRTATHYSRLVIIFLHSLQSFCLPQRREIQGHTDCYFNSSTRSQSFYIGNLTFLVSLVSTG